MITNLIVRKEVEIPITKEDSRSSTIEQVISNSLEAAQNVIESEDENDPEFGFDNENDLLLEEEEISE